MLPQLDFSHYTSQIFWLVVCFCILIVAMKRLFIPKMNGIIEKREETIAKNSEKLVSLEAERDELNREVMEQDKKIAQKSAGILKKVDVKYDKMLAEQLTNLKHEQEKVVSQLRTKYENDIKAIETTEPDRIDALVSTAMQKLIEAK